MLAQRLLIDGHVHAYDCFDEVAALCAAARNFHRQAQRLGWEDAFLGVLMLTETAGDRWFERRLDTPELADRSGTRWSLTTTPGALPALLAICTGRTPLLIVPGRQVITRERLEVLTLMTRDTVPDGLPLDEVLARARETSALTVLPWAVGKWTGKRGRLIEQCLIRYAGDPSLLVGDNSGRPALWRTPRALARGRELGYRLLPGTDPLPLAGEEARIGTFGAALEHPLADDNPMADLRQGLTALDTVLAPFGRLESATGFVRNQLRLRLERRRRSQAATGSAAR